MLRIHANPRLSPICLQPQEIVGKYVMMNSLYFYKQEPPTSCDDEELVV